jgi:flagellar biosynthesis/type III secretory pathway protein FliH
LSSRFTLPLRRPLRGVRLHVVTPSPTPPVARLLELKERERAAVRTAGELGACLAALQRAVGALPSQVEARLAEVAAMATELGLALAREVVGAAVEQGLCDPRRAVERCLREAVPGSTGATVRVCAAPADLAILRARIAETPELSEQTADAEFAADPALPRGAVRIETGAGRAQWDPQDTVERLCRALREELGG